MRKMIASDFDGTLSRGGVSWTDRIAVSDWRRCGNLFGIVTGRNISSILKSAGPIGMDFYVASGGASVHDSAGNVLVEHRMDGALMEFFREMGEKYNVPIVTLVLPGAVTAGLRRNGETKKIGKPEGIYMISNGFSSDGEAHAYSQVLAQYPDLFNANQNGCCVDVTPVGVNKATGIEDYLQYIGWRKEQVITVGDNYNDIPMVREYNGVTVENGVDALKKIARSVYVDFSELVKDNL